LKLKENELISKNEALSAKEKEIKELDIKKNELEYLIKKASMSLFLKDQLERTDSRITEIANENKELYRLITQRKTILQQLKETDEEIKLNPNIDLINEILESTKIGLNKETKRKKPETFFDYLSIIAEELSKTLTIKF
jgi:ribosomal protein L9